MKCPIGSILVLKKHPVLCDANRQNTMINIMRRNDGGGNSVMQRQNSSHYLPTTCPAEQGEESYRLLHGKPGGY